MRTYYEHQVFQEDGAFYFTLTTSVGKDHWTSRPVSLTAEDWDGAVAEARTQVVALMKAQSTWGIAGNTVKLSPVRTRET